MHEHTPGGDLDFCMGYIAICDSDQHHHPPATDISEAKNGKEVNYGTNLLESCLARVENTRTGGVFGVYCLYPVSDTMPRDRTLFAKVFGLVLDQSGFHPRLHSIFDGADSGLCSFCIDDFFLEELTYRELDTVHLVPKLQKLTFGFVSDNFAEELLETMIRLRWWSDQALQALLSPPPVARLRDIGVSRGYDFREVSASFQARITQLRAEGLEIAVR
ncbi:hypothetical protein GGX14DRAFT_198760 [Mycena pura]|uniref:Uncharacterized protein n=1 Tax=Mycena pura TaxID=153505 RepID=A0AAD6Y682_9AGAR|nr:hypothetical protein GGX14DRAFT_198760 [Mycena pura]